MIDFRIATNEDAEKLIEHETSHMQELGFNNLPAHPFLNTHVFVKDVNRKLSQFEKSTNQPGWGRSFIAIDNGKIIGHLNIKNDLETALHRTQLGMGIDLQYRGKKIGAHLMKMAIDFCRAEKIEYIDLSVFAHNLPARKLYKSFGFIEIGTKVDLFRMYGHSIDDVLMYLKL